MPLHMFNVRLLFPGMLLVFLSQPLAWSQTTDQTAELTNLRERAEQGNAKAQTQLGYHYHTGDGVKRDYGKALKWYRLAAEQGNADAQYNLGVAHAFGEGVDKDLTQASNWYQQAAEQGHKVAAFSLGLSYLYGDGVQQDGSEAATWFRLSAEQGYTRAQVHLASIYHTGEGVPQDHEAAAYWYRQAAERGDATAQYNLGNLYRAGRGIPKDDDAARDWFGKAAEQDYAPAKVALESFQQRPSKPAAAEADDNRLIEPMATMPAIETGALASNKSTERKRVVSPPIEASDQSAGGADKAVASAATDQKATESNTASDTDADGSNTPSPTTAQSEPAGNSSDVNAEPAMSGFADMTEAEGGAEQQTTDDARQTPGQTTDEQAGGIAGFFGTLFGGNQRTLNGAATADVPDNSEWREPVAEQPADQATDTDTTPAEQGQQDAQTTAVLELKDDPSASTTSFQISDATRAALASENYAEAVRLLQQQALNGNAAAETQLGNLYFQGRGVEQNYDRALLWYRRAAKRRYADAQYNLGNMYLMGEGVLQSDSKARDWYAKAAAQGHESAANNLKNLKRRLANQQRYNPDNHKGPTQREMQNALEEKNQQDAPAAETDAAPPQPSDPSPTSSGRIVSPPLAPAPERRNTSGQDNGASTSPAESGKPQKQNAVKRIVSPPLETTTSD